MDDVLLELMLGRLGAVPLEQEAERLLLAACDGDAALAAELRGEGPGDGEQRLGGPDAEPVGAFLRSITVAGFRGIGPGTTLELEPGPGLTLVVGRNGSGKSSFAEGLEVLLTGDLRRWQEHAAWRQGWRNLHEPDCARLSAELVIEGVGPAAAERAWDSGAAFADSRASVQVAGEKRSGPERLAWQDALVSHRPFLSHSELEAFFSRPSQLYELLFSVLGLEDLTAADKRLVAARKEREDGLKEVNGDLPALLTRLDSVDDERARSCRSALEGRTRDHVRAIAIAAGSAVTQLDSELGRLRQLSLISVPDSAQVETVVKALTTAADALAAVAGSQADQAMTLVSLLSAALKHYIAHGSGPCPVCGNAGALNESWRTRTEQEIARLEGQAAEARQAHAQAAGALAEAGKLIQDVPAALLGPAVGAADPMPARQAWARWPGQPDERGSDELRQLANHITLAWTALSAAVTTLGGAAQAELQAREDLWAPVAKDVMTWCARAQDAEAAAAPVPSLKKAQDWLKKANDGIRNDRLAPLGNQARAIWSQLRQESNVDLGVIRLSGSSTQRKLDVSVTVDGAAGSGLAVMSQGEVNALALSIFLPRATITTSPFRFLVIDDPVQAMDPAKVEGLARVLEDVSRSRQVLVFTHDDRLPEAVRRLSIPGRILEVTRRPRSLVSIRPALTPVEQQLKDASDLCADDALPGSVAARVVPGLCRLAIEAEFTEAIRRTQLRSGMRHTDVEAGIEAANTLTKKAALAIFRDASRGGDVLPRIGNWHRAAADTYQALNRGTHDGHRGSLRALIRDTRALSGLIREKLR